MSSSRRRSTSRVPVVDMSLHGPGVTGASNSCPSLCPYSSSRALTARRTAPKLRDRTGSATSLASMVSRSPGGPRRPPPVPSNLSSLHMEISTTSSANSSVGAGVAQPPSMSSGLSTLQRLRSGFGGLVAAGGSRLNLTSPNTSLHGGSPGPTPTSASASAASAKRAQQQQAQLALGTGGGGAANPALATESEDDVILTISSLRAFRRSWLREALYWLLGLLTGGLLLLLCKWMPDLQVRLRFVELEAQADPDADLAMVTSLDAVLSLSPIMALDPDTLEWLPAARLRARLHNGEPIVRRFDWRYERFWCEPATASASSAAAAGVWTRRAFDLRGRPYSELHRIAAERVAEGILDPKHHAAKVRAATYGANMTDIDVPPYYMMVINELLKPFFIFQVFSLAVWVMQEYYVYMYSILAMTTYSVLANAYGEWRNLRALQTLARSESVVDRVSLDPLVGRAGGLVTEAVPSSELHPGDLIRIIPNMTLPCDVVLITGHAILSEAMLTGEAAPVMKASLPPGDTTLFRPSSERDKKYVLFSGTKVLQARCGPLPRLPQHKALPLEESKYVWETVVEPPASSSAASATRPHPSPSSQSEHSTLRGLGDLLLLHHQRYTKPIAVGMVMRTGFSTARGQLVRAILFPPPPKFDFEKQGYRFIWVLCSALLVGIICQVTIYARNGEKVLPTIKDLLNLVTIAIPPALPLSLSIGLQVSFARLKLKGVFCSHTRSVAAAGRVNCLCFDKTGTLTEDGLTLTGVQVVEEQPRQPQQPQQQQAQGGDEKPQPQPQAPVLGPALADPAHLYIRHVQEQQQQGGGKVKQGQQEDGSSLYAPAVLVSLVMAACHSVSTLDEEDEMLNRSTATLTLSAAKCVFEGMHEGSGSNNLLSSLPMIGDVFPMVRNTSLSLSVSNPPSLADGDGSEYGGGGGASGTEGIALMRATSMRSSASGISRSSSSGHLRLGMQRSRSVGSSASGGVGSFVRRNDSNSSLSGQPAPPPVLPIALAGPMHSAPGTLPSSSLASAATSSATGLDPASGLGGSSSLLSIEMGGPPTPLAQQRSQPPSLPPVPQSPPPPQSRGQDGSADDPGAAAGAAAGVVLGAASAAAVVASPAPSPPPKMSSNNKTPDRRASFGQAMVVSETGEAVPHVPSSSSSLPVYTGPAPHQLVGDSLEVQLFLSSGWRFCTRPEEDERPNGGGGRRGLRAPADAMLQMAGVFDEAGVWAHPDLPAGTDTVILPPAALAGKPGAVALAVVRRLDFDADLRRMGVIVQVLVAVDKASAQDPGRRKGPLLLLVKGAPEAMRDLCLAPTLPQNLGPELHRLTCSGLRVLGCAWRHVAAEEVSLGRAELERDLRFLGLMTMENRLKAETVPYLSLFRSAAFRIIMITGDNPATAAAVGRMAGAFCTPKPDAPTLVLDGDGTPEQPLSVSDMTASSPTASLSLREYLAAFFPASADVTVRLPASEQSPASTAGAGAGGAVAAAASPLKGPHDLVVTGRAFEALHRAHEEALEAEDDEAGGAHEGGWTALEVVIGKASIFARMSPQHKQDLVRALQDTGLVVCMTGDGANDSGALKAGDIGISIAAKAAEPAEPAAPGAAGGAGATGAQTSPEVSKAEAAVLAAPSIAAPFATGIHHIGAVSIILAEGRCALTTSVTMFKYMFLYGIIQFVSVLILYALVLELTAEQYLWADMGVVLGLVILVPTMGPKAFLQRGRPETNLVSPTILRSIIGQTVIVVIFQVMQQVMLSRESWYTRSVIDKSNVTAASIPPTNEATSKFLFGNYQYICSCLAFCQTYGLFRQPVYRTPVLAAYLVAELVIATVFCLGSIPGLEYAFNLTELPLQYRAEVFLLASCYGACAILYERFCVPHVSDDEEPVPPEMVGPIQRAQGAEQAAESATEAYTSMSLEEMERAEQEKMLCSCLDTQPTLLPKLRRGPPLYHQLRQAWSDAEDRMDRLQREQGFASMAT